MKTYSNDTIGPSRLILHVLQPSQFLPLLVQTAFSPSLIHVSAHHPSLISYLAKDYLTPPPPLSHDAKFWGVFLPVSERSYDTDCLVFGGDGEGSGNSPELVVDILVRGLDASGRKRGVERLLEGWSPMFNGACDLMMLESMKNIGSKRAVEEVDTTVFHFIRLCSIYSLLLRARRIQLEICRLTSVLPPHNINLELRFLFHMHTKVGVFCSTPPLLAHFLSLR